jgi:hypothetical protein
MWSWSSTRRVDWVSRERERAFTTSHDDEALCYAIFDRACDAFVETERRTDLDQDWFWRLAMRYNVGIALP